MNDLLVYFLIVLAIVSVLGFVFAGIAKFMRRADHMGEGQGQPKSEIKICRRWGLAIWTKGGHDGR